MSSTYTVRSILGKTRLHRPDLREAEIDYLTQETVRKICRLTMLAQENLEYYFNGPIEAFTPVPSNGNKLNRVHQVRFQDSVIEKPTAPTVTLTPSATGYATGKRLIYTIVAVGPQGWVSKHSDLSTVITTSGNLQTIITMPTPPKAPNGFYNFNLYKQVLNSSDDKSINGISIATQAVVTYNSAHGYVAGDYITLFNVDGMTAINGKVLNVVSVTSSVGNYTVTVDLDTTDAATYAIYTSGGTSSKINISGWNRCSTKLTCQQGPNISAVVDSNNRLAGTVTISNVVYTCVNFETSTSEISDVPTGDFRTLGEANYQGIKNSLPKPDAVSGTPNLWAYDAENNEVHLYPPPSVITREVRLTCVVSYIPVGEIDEIPLLQESEDAVIYGTLAEAYMLPGPGQNLQLAKNYEIKFNYEMSNLKAVAIQGQSGRLTVTANPLGGRRRKPYGAWGSPWDNSWGW